MRRFLASQADISGDTLIIRQPEEIHHINRVLRLKPGERILVSDTTDFEYICQINDIQSRQVTAKILDKQRPTGETEHRVDLFQAVPKHPKMETVIQKSVELGVSAIIPILTGRTLADQVADVEKRQERWQRIAAEAVKQCRRGRVPPVRPTLAWGSVRAELEKYDLILFPYENEQGTTLKAVLQGIGRPPAATAVIIGPEGGFGSTEAEQIEAAGGRSVSLGQTILRTETAGLVTLAMLRYEWEL